MVTKSKTHAKFNHQQVEVEGISIHAVIGGDKSKPAMVFLHGWPESWALYEDVMAALSDEACVVAIDLPAVGLSTGVPSGNDKKTLSKYVRGVIQKLDLKDVTLVGHDCGGMIAYAYLHAYPDDLKGCVIMNTVIPGVEPWQEVLSNPYIWHFAFHSISELPEQLVTGKETAYFNYFFNILAGPAGMNQELRQQFTEAYLRPEALKTGFDWYRCFQQDAKDNAAVKDQAVAVPVLYLRGDHENARIAQYLNGLRDNGLHQLEGAIIPNSGHFSPSENPEATVNALRKFVGS